MWFAHPIHFFLNLRIEDTVYVLTFDLILLRFSHDLLLIVDQNLRVMLDIRLMTRNIIASASDITRVQVLRTLLLKFLQRCVIYRHHSLFVDFDFLLFCRVFILGVTFTLLDSADCFAEFG